MLDVLSSVTLLTRNHVVETYGCHCIVPEGLYLACPPFLILGAWDVCIYQP